MKILDDFTLEEIKDINTVYTDQEHNCQRFIYESKHALKMHKFDGCEAGRDCEREKQLIKEIGEAETHIVTYKSIVKKTNAIIEVSNPIESE